MVIISLRTRVLIVTSIAQGGVVYYPAIREEVHTVAEYITQPYWAVWTSPDGLCKLTMCPIPANGSPQGSMGRGNEGLRVCL